MSDEIVSQPPAVFSSKERAALVARALSEAARRASFSTRRRRTMAGGVRRHRGAQVSRLIRIWTFVGIVVVPGLVVAGYLYLVAAPQYVAEARFTVRGGVPPAITDMGQLGGAPTMLIVQDTQVLLQFVLSRAMVEHLDRAVGYQGLFQGSSIDWLSRLQPHQAIEKVVRYWKKHVSLSVELPSGIVVLDVRAFTPDDAVRIADAVLEASEQLVNGMNDKMREDAVTLAQTERQKAETHLVATRAALERARNEEGTLSASDESRSITKLVETVQGERLKMQQEYDSQRRYVREDAPQLRNLHTKIDAAQKEIDALRAQVTRSPSSNTEVRPVLSGSMTRLDAANLENGIAEKIYAMSLAALEQARLASESKLMYINTFVRPVAAQESDFPKRGLDLLIFTGAAVGAWLVMVGGLSLARNVV